MMDFSETPEQQALRKSIRDFLSRHAPEEAITEWEAKGEYPVDVFRRMAELGWVAAPFPSELGGMGGSVVDMCILSEELGRASYDISTGLGLTIFCGLNVARHGTAEQITTYLEPALSGDRRFAIAMTEPGSGSDAASLSTRARRARDGWMLNGQKVFISGAHIPDTTLLLAARTSEEKEKQAGISIFMLPNDAPGVTINRLSMLGRNIVGTNEVFLDDVSVGEEALLGDLGQGWRVLGSGLLLERLYVSAAYLGSAETLVTEALAHAGDREQFGRRIGDFQAVGHLLADMRSSVDAMRWLVYHAAWLLDRGEEATRQVSAAKLFGSETLLVVARHAMQILGGYGFANESPVQRHFRDAQAATITAGTSQMQRTIIARTMGLNPK